MTRDGSRHAPNWLVGLERTLQFNPGKEYSHADIATDQLPPNAAQSGAQG